MGVRLESLNIVEYFDMDIIQYFGGKVNNVNPLDGISECEQGYYERKYGVNGEYLYRSEAENLGLSIPAYFTVSDEKKERVKNSLRRSMQKSATHLGKIPVVEYEAEIYHGGDRIDLRVHRSATDDERKRGGKRSEIRGFSRASRFRLFKKVAALHQEKAQKRGRPIFVTLTYPNEYPTDFGIYKRDLDVFAKRVRRKYPSTFFVWRLEFQKRGAPHYHLLVFGVGKIPKTWLSRVWYEIVGSEDEKHFKAGTEVKRVRSWRGVWSYVSKYLGKVPETQENVPESTGRFWGVYNRVAFGRCVVKEVVALSRELFYRARRILARATNYSLSRYGRWMGLTAFVKADMFARVFNDTS